jgi:hypothetical protein
MNSIDTVSQSDFIKVINQRLKNSDSLKQLSTIPRTEQMEEIKATLKKYSEYTKTKKRKQAHNREERPGKAFFDERQLLVEYLSNFSLLALECYVDDSEYFALSNFADVFAAVPSVSALFKSILNLLDIDRILHHSIIKQAIKVNNYLQS